MIGLKQVASLIHVHRDMMLISEGANEQEKAKGTRGVSKRINRAALAYSAVFLILPVLLFIFL